MQISNAQVIQVRVEDDQSEKLGLPVAAVLGDFSQNETFIFQFDLMSFRSVDESSFDPYRSNSRQFRRWLVHDDVLVRKSPQSIAIRNVTEIPCRLISSPVELLPQM